MMVFVVMMVLVVMKVMIVVEVGCFDVNGDDIYDGGGPGFQVGSNSTSIVTLAKNNHARIRCNRTTTLMMFNRLKTSSL